MIKCCNPFLFDSEKNKHNIAEIRKIIIIGSVANYCNSFLFDNEEKFYV